MQVLKTLMVAVTYLFLGLLLAPFAVDYLGPYYDRVGREIFEPEKVVVTKIEKVMVPVSRPVQKPIQIPVAIPKADYTESTEDLYCMAHGIYLEGRNQSVEGQIQIGYVIMNRVKTKSHGWPDTICGVVYKRKAFSFTLDKPYINLGNSVERAAYIRAIRVAKGVIDGTFEDKTEGATHYFAPKGMKDGKDPWWAKDYEVVAKVEDHIFLK